MWSIVVGSYGHAMAVAAYATAIGCTSTKTSYADLHKSYHIEVECELKHRRQIRGFVDGLEWYGDTHSICE